MSRFTLRVFARVVFEVVARARASWVDLSVQFRRIRRTRSTRTAKRLRRRGRGEGKAALTGATEFAGCGRRKTVAVDGTFGEHRFRLRRDGIGRWRGFSNGLEGEHAACRRIEVREAFRGLRRFSCS